MDATTHGSESDRGEDTARSPRVPRWAKVLLALTLVAAVAVGGTLIWLSSRYSYDTFLEREAEIAARGEPTCLDDLRRGGEGGAGRVRAAWMWLDENRPNEPEFPAREDVWTPEQVEEFRAYVTGVGPAIAQLDAALGYDEIRFVRELRDDHAFQPDRMVSGMQSLNRMITLRQGLALRHGIGDPGIVLGDSRRMLGICSRWETHNLIQELVATAITSVHLHHFLDVLSYPGACVDHPAAEILALLPPERRPGLWRNLCFERAVWLRVGHAHLGEEQRFVDFTEETRRQNRIPLPGMQPVEVYGYLDLLDRLDEVGGLLRQPARACHAGLEAVGERGNIVLHRVAKAICVTLPLVHARASRVDAQVRITRLAAALRIHREHHGAWPADLTELTPILAGGIPTDPLSGRPFAYEVTDDGAAHLWSQVGDDPGPWWDATDAPWDLQDIGLDLLLRDTP